MVTEAEVVGSTMSQTAEASGTVQREKREVAKIKRLTWQTVLLIAEIEKEVGESNITAVVEGEGTQGVQEDERARYEIRLCGFGFLKYVSSAHYVTTISSILQNYVVLKC
jgi:predicted transcriptional regulator